MKKIVKSFIALLCIVLTLANCSSVFASEKALSIDNINTQQIQTYHVYKPDKSWNLSKKSYRVDGSADLTVLYTSYYFTGVESMKITIKNHYSNDLTVNVYKMGSIDLLRSSKKIEGGKSLTWIVNTKKTANYYLQFSAECKVTGTVSNGG